MEKVSVIIPIYNAEKNIETCLNSIVKQTYKDIEIICVNDGSKDETLSILNKYSQEDSRILVINKENSGPSDSRNLGLEYSTGKYIIFIDADDSIEKNMIENLVKKLIENKSELVFCNFYNVNSNGKTKNKANLKRIFTSRKNFLKYFDKYYTKSLINPPWNKIYIKDRIKHKFDSNLILGEDLDFNIKYFNEIEKVAIMDEYLYNYTIDNAESITSIFSSNSDEYFNMYLKMFNDLFYENEVVTSIKFDLFFIKDYIAHFSDEGNDKQKAINLYKSFYNDIHTRSLIDKLKKRIIFSKLSYLVILNIYCFVKRRK